MKLTEALKLVNQRIKETALRHNFTLASGFTPLHLKTLLGGELAQRIPEGAIAVETGLFGDLLGTLRNLATQGNQKGIAIVIEWSDLDPRLGWRTTHGWRVDRLMDVSESACRRIDEIGAALLELSKNCAVAISLPTLPLPPLFISPTQVGDPCAWILRARVCKLAETLATSPLCRVVDTQWIDTVSPLAGRHDVSSDLRTGFPYQMEHAATLAKALAALLKPTSAKRGIITDLDNTLWQGIIGEDGVENISWGLDQKSLGHGLYQEQLAALADLGVLVAVASKNDHQIAMRGLAREDLVIPKEKLFPIEANWGPKSESIKRIIAAWNIHPDSVVFIDDSPTEIAEVSASFPQITTMRFPTGDETAIARLIIELRDLFGKSKITTEDKLRVDSLRANQQFADSTINPDDFLASAESSMILEWNGRDTRTFELLNKTNQFNLNGKRIDEANWSTLYSDPSRFVVNVSYTDKYAPLGKIGAIVGRHSNSHTASIDAWVLSCRAFSRRIEHAMLAALFDYLRVRTLTFDYVKTERNGPLQVTLRQLIGPDFDTTSAPISLTRSQFDQTCPLLFAKVLNHDQLLTDAA